MNKAIKIILILFFIIGSAIGFLIYRYNLSYGETVFQKAMMLGCMQKTLKDKNHTKSKNTCECVIGSLFEKYSENEIRQKLDSIKKNRSELFSDCSKIHKESTESIEPKIDTSSYILKFELPDTVKTKTLVKGEVHYNTKLNPHELNKTSKRYIFLHTTLDKNPQEFDLEALEKNKKRFIYEDTTGTGRFRFEFTVKNSGEKFFHGLIEDIRVLKADKKTDSVTIVTQHTTLTKDLVVE